jgi:hypothetical protein
MAHKIYVNRNEIEWMNRLVKEGKSIKEIAETTHRSQTSVKKFTKEARAKRRSQEQLPLLVDDNTELKIGDVDENGMIELKMGNFVLYLSTYDVIALVKRLVAKLEEELMKEHE